MIYESFYPKFSIAHPVKTPEGSKGGSVGMINFVMGAKKSFAINNHVSSFYGRLDSNSKSLQSKMGGMTASEIEACIEGDPAFQSNYNVNDKGKVTSIKEGGTIGVNGVWRASDRKSIEDNVADKQSAISRFAQLGDDVLRQIAQGGGLAIPGNATHDQLVALAEEATNPSRSALETPKGPKRGQATVVNAPVVS